MDYVKLRVNKIKYVFSLKKCPSHIVEEQNEYNYEGHRSEQRRLWHQSKN